MPDQLLPLALLLPLLGAPLIIVASWRSRSLCAWTAAAVMAASLAALAPLFADALAGTVHTVRLPWLPEWGLDLALRLDGLGLLFSLLILGIGLLVVLYAAYYMPESDRLGRFYALILLFAGGMLGVVLTENLILMLVFWELTSLTSFLLIAYKYEAHDARIAARMALAVTGGGGLALLAGILLLGHIAGSFELSEILVRGEAIRAHALYAPMLVLILLGAFTKSAQFPFHFWLPNAMAAPTPVSAYLHSATMVKAGVFLLARLYPVLSGTDLWLLLVGTTGAVTFVYGAYVAMLKHDFKGLLAYSTISHLGLITLLFGLETPMSAVAAVFHIINHAIFKASLFMAAGIIDHECGTRDMRRISGMFKYMPRTAVLGILAAGSMAGVPLLNGFLSKEMFFAETVGHPAFEGHTFLLPAFATIAAMLSVAYSARFVHDVFFDGDPVNLPRTPQEAPTWLRLPVEILVGLVLLVGLLPQISVGPILNAAAGAVLPGRVPAFELAVWHGFNPPLIMSFAALGFGILYYWQRQVLFDLHDRYAPKISSPVAFERVYKDATLWSRSLMSVLDNRSLQRYLALFLAFVLAIGAWAWWGSGPPGPFAGRLAATQAGGLAYAALAALAVAACGVVLMHRKRLIAVIFTSAVGLLATLTFVRFAAPDLAITQLSVEVVTIVLLLLGLRYLPGEVEPETPRAFQIRDAALSVLGGVAVGALAYAMLTRPYDTIAGFHVANAVSGGGGANVVNVMLVDFRGFDTLGEITVLAMVALGLHAILEGVRLRPYTRRPRKEADRHPVMLAELMRPLLPLILAVSVYIFLRGHNLPGGGFVAGLIAAVALMLQYLASGIDFAAPRLRIDTVRLLGLGLALAVGTGAGSWLFGTPFLTGTFGHFHLPLAGDFELATAMIFDVGVLLVVVGCVLLALIKLGLLNRREVDSLVTQSAEG